ncbi:hypothetical protein BATDEDRAFT_87316 [Batrachochytrium dendrobatidis JAM81]|uniref:Cystinosin n=2 Tax=Batrachochytrium dendrobatidis TaxID=109871 RepID=F4NY54_BATDJ|nr:cystinosin-like protein ERS1 [Batrachochytrium dendrobatidis JAM81]EGF81955.1 hypothetical protein BATDEDRAFT_87316 [Batrachochytrium dendrobatidis JAM81]OAJ40715.1 hypothetical protein BDEG_24420 [Batrachochytrium dendrobatidis JEL423]|eukprot:XP_006677582.1 hypothetical protein BATDEDRAFT_87316 [Batrachochytrium dendrobatidis JAM81]
MIAWVVSAILGWSYFIAWSLSFYPQAILNYSTKSVQGLSLDFVCFNATGFLCYAIYNVTLYTIPLARNQYRDRYDTEATVQLNDVVFSVHALVLSFTVFCQMIAWGHRSTPNPTLSLWAVLFLTAVFMGSVIIMFLIMWPFTHDTLQFYKNSAYNWQWINLLEYFAAVKMLVTLVKYTPQALMHYYRKSTAGWSIWNTLMDFSGGILSLLQLAVDGANSSDWTGITGNPIKLGLGCISIFFDLVFMYQHYILYANRHVQIELIDDAEANRLIEQDEQDEIVPTSTYPVISSDSI